MRRMDRYKDEDELDIPTRASKNQDLYQNIGNNTRYTNFEDITSDINSTNAYDLEAVQKNYNTREGYHRIKEYQDVVTTPKVKKELDEFNYFYKNKENRIYDINSVLEEARKNRLEKEEQLEEKRKLKNNDYNILSSVNKEELEKYRREKVERPQKNQDGELRDLLDTITSKTLAGEIDKETTVDLLSDLMATNVFDRIEKPEPSEKESKEKTEETPESESENTEEKLKTADIAKKLEEEEEEKQNNTEELKGLKGADTDFYTRSMDLSEKDFNFYDENTKKMPLILKIFLALIIIAVIAAAAYYIYQII